MAIDADAQGCNFLHSAKEPQERTQRHISGFLRPSLHLRSFPDYNRWT